MNNKSIRIMLDMSVTLLHNGHVRLIQNAKKIHGGTLVVGLSTDRAVETMKGYKPELNYEQRKEILLALADVDEVVPFDIKDWDINDQYLDEHNIDYLIHGSDIESTKPRIKIVPRTTGISSSDMRTASIKVLYTKFKKKNKTKQDFIDYINSIIDWYNE